MNNNYTYLYEELKKSFLVGKSNKTKLFVISILITLFSFTISEFFTAFSNTVVEELFSQFGMKTFFSIASLFNYIVIVFIIFYMMQRYYSVTMAEVGKNRWYLLQKTGFTVREIVFYKQFSVFLMTVVIYMLGYLFVIAFALILKYSIILNSMLSLFIVGFIQISWFVSILMTLSTFIKNTSVASFCILILAIIAGLISYYSGCYTIINSNFLMQNTSNLFVGKASIYTYFLIITSLTSYIISTIIAIKKSNNYTIKNTKLKNIVIVDYLTNSVEKPSKINAELAYKIIKYAVSFIFVGIFVLGIIANVFFLFVSSKSSEQDYSVLNRIPFVVQSDTMKDDIKRNDFILFTKSSDRQYRQGDIVVFYTNNTANIRKIIEVQSDDNYVVDINYYPDSNLQGVLKETINGSQISGIMSFRSRWVGAWLVWSMSIFGRITTLALPLVVIAFYDKVVALWAVLKRILGYTEPI